MIGVRTQAWRRLGRAFAGLCAFAACSACDESTTAPDGGRDAAASESGTSRGVEIGPDLTACEEHVDCRLVETACSRCCKTGAIAVDRMDAFDAAFERACSDYRGAECDCAPPDVIARCREGACQAVAREDVEECFSPTQNLWTATSADAVGCRCDAGDGRACTSTGAIECAFVGGTGEAAWHAVGGKACLPRKLEDAVDPSDPDAVTVHLFVVPANAPPVPLDIWLDDVHVVTGYFEYGSPDMDPGHIYDFDVSVAAPTVTLRAEGPDAELEESIDVPAERWVLVSYDLDNVTTPGEVTPRLRVDVSEHAVGFD
jgi:hypothetical protein